MDDRYSLHPDRPNWRRLGPTDGDAAVRALGDVVSEQAASRGERWSRGFTRRRLLQGGLGMGVALLGAQMVTTRVSYAAASEEGANGALVVLFLRGGMDGLSVLVPFEDPVLLAARPDIAIRGAQLLPVDQRFGLHPALGGLAPLLKAGKVAAVPDIATPELSRSHFQAQDCLERGGVSNGDSRGWLDRVLEASGAGTTFRSLSATNPLTRSLVGSSQSLVVRNLDSLTIDADGDTLDRTRRALELLYTGIDHPYAVQSSIALEAAAAAGQIPPSSAESTFPDGGFGDDLSMLSSIIRADLGMRVATIDLGGWDMHTGVGNVDAGDMTMMLAALGDGIAAFFDSLGDKAASTTMVVMSEFGRRVEQNGTGGTDHGHGGLALAIGGGVRGGVHGAWEALDAGMLERGDLPGRNDFRDLLSEVVAARLGLSASQMSGVFPGWKASPMGLMATG